MRKKQINLYNVQDCKNIDGIWVKTSTVTLGTSYEVSHTRASVVWGNMDKRTKPHTKKKVTYENCTNGFKNFQEFAEWCQGQEGYMNKEDNGNYWSLDKDIIFPGNRVYSPETCMFVPNYVNCIFNTRDNDRGEFALGVHWHGRDEVFVAQCSSPFHKRFLGYYETEEAAHRHWQVRKVSDLRSAIALFNSSERLVAALNNRILLLEEDLTYNRITKLF